MSEWSDWIEHDGTRPEIPSGTIHVVYLRVTGIMAGEGASISYDFPSFYWRWHRVRTGWFRTERRRVCDDPAYAPIIRYRYRKSSGLVLLERIAADPETVDCCE